MSTATTIHTLTLPTGHALLEVFPRNANPHAVLRVTVSTATHTRSATFAASSPDLTGVDLAGLGSADASFENGELVLEVGGRVVRLRIAESVERHVFVSRVVVYLSYYEGLVARERGVVEELQRKKGVVWERVLALGAEKLKLDGMVTRGLPVLLASKHLHEP